MVNSITLSEWKKEYLLKLVSDTMRLYKGDKAKTEDALMKMADLNPELMKDLAWHGHFIAKAMSEKPDTTN